MWARLKATIVDFIQQADLVLLGLCCLAGGYGLVLIYSASHRLSSNLRLVAVQGVAILLGVVCYIFFSTVDIEEAAKKWKWILGFNVLLMCCLVPFGVDSYGNRAWIQFPGFPVTVGPAEIIKITFAVLLSKQLAWLREERHDLKSIRAVGFLAAHLGLIAGLYYVLSSDMGNTLMFLLIFVAVTFVAGVALRWFIIGGGAAVAAFWAAWHFDFMPSHIRERFMVLLDHSYDPQGVGWQQTRSIVALGSGQITGQGLLNGTQTQSGSLPFAWTDFIFSACGEELGMIGCLAVLLLLGAIIARCLLVARRAKTPMSAYVCVGLASMLIFQTVENVGMCLFVLPVIGLTLPFFSYGGSSMVMLFCAMGIISGIKKRSRPDWLRDR